MNTLSHLSLEDIKATEYVDSLMGPMKPGLFWYKWLCKGPTLSLPIAEVLLSDDNYVRYIHNDDQGNVSLLKAVHDDIDMKGEMITKFMTTCVEKSGRLDDGLVEHDDSLLQRVVAVRKTPTWKQFVSNRVEVLLPYPAQAAAQKLMDTRNKNEVLQRYVRVKSRNANVFRVFWKMKPGTKSVVNGYSITCKKEMEPLQDERLRRASTMMASKRAQEIGILPEGGLPSSPETGQGSSALDGLFLGQVQDSPFMNELEVSSSERIRTDSQKFLAATTCATCTDDSKGCVTQDSARLVTATRVSELALKGVSIYMERLAWWIQCCLQRAEGLNLAPSELVADFVRDMNGNYVFVQLKGFRIATLTRERVQKWFLFKMRRENLDDEEDRGPRHKSGPLAGLSDMDLLNPALMTRLKGTLLKKQNMENMGKKCTLCSLVFYSTDVVAVGLDRAAKLGMGRDAQGVLMDFTQNKDKGPPVLGAKRATPTKEPPSGLKATGNSVSSSASTATDETSMSGSERPVSIVAHSKRHPSGNGTVSDTHDDRISGGVRAATEVDVPAFGYSISVKMAYNVLQRFRDAGFPLNETSRKILASYEPNMEVTAVGHTKALEDATRKSVHGTVTCCFRCFEVLLEHSTRDQNAEKLYSILGTPPDPRVKSSKMDGLDEPTEEGEDRTDTGESHAGDVGQTTLSTKTNNKATMRSDPFDDPSFFVNTWKARQGGSGFESGLKGTSLGMPGMPAADKARRLSPSRRSVAPTTTRMIEADKSRRGSARAAKTTEQHGTHFTDHPVMGRILKATPLRTTLAPGIYQVSDFGRTTTQWRMLVAAHYITGATESEKIPVGALGGISYSVGQQKVVLPLLNECENRTANEPINWIKQCRTHTFMGGASEVHNFFRSGMGDIQFDMYWPNAGNSDIARAMANASIGGSRRPQSAGARSQGGNRGDRLTAEGRYSNMRRSLSGAHEDDGTIATFDTRVRPKLQTDCSFTISLKGLRWDEVSRDGQEKLDLHIKLVNSQLGPDAQLYVTVAVCLDDFISPHISGVDCRKDARTSIFWPPAWYQPHVPLPEAWIGMLTPFGPGTKGYNKDDVDGTEKAGSNKRDRVERPTSSKDTIQRMSGDTAQQRYVAQRSRRLHLKLSEIASRGNVSTIDPDYPNTVPERVMTGTLPSAMRKKRRLLLVLALFENVAREEETVDVVELREYMEWQCEAVTKQIFTSTDRSKSNPLPLISHNLEKDLIQNVSFTMAYISTLLLKFSPHLKTLFQSYDQVGSAGLSLAAFLSACEECFMLLSTQRGRASLNLQDKVTAAMSYLVGREFEGPQPDVDSLEVTLPPALAKCVVVHEEQMGMNRRKTLADSMLLYKGPLARGDAGSTTGAVSKGSLNLIATRSAAQHGRHRRENAPQLQTIHDDDDGGDEDTDAVIDANMAELVHRHNNPYTSSVKPTKNKNRARRATKHDKASRLANRIATSAAQARRGSIAVRIKDPEKLSVPDLSFLFKLDCDLHGETRFFSADLCCTKCEAEWCNWSDPAMLWHHE